MKETCGNLEHEKRMQPEQWSRSVQLGVQKGVGKSMKNRHMQYASKNMELRTAGNNM